MVGFGVDVVAVLKLFKAAVLDLTSEDIRGQNRDFTPTAGVGALQ